MAAINVTAASGLDHILTFGKYYQTIVAMEPDMVHDRRLLHPEEASFIRGIAASDDSTTAVVCQERLDLGLDYYYAVKHQITSFQRVWDAIIDEKHRYDAVGWPQRSRTFMDSFRLCSYLIPQRVSVEFLGPCVGTPQLDISLGNNPILSRSASYHSDTSTVVNSPARWAEYEESNQGGNYGERLSSSDEDYPEALALSPTPSNDSFENVDVQDSGAEIISISDDDDDDDDSDSDYSDETTESDDSEELQFRLQLDRENVPSGGCAEPDPYRSKDLDDGLWERLLSSLPETQPSYRQEAQRDENVSKLRPEPNEGKPLSLELESVAPRKRKFLAVQGSDGREYEGTSRGDKRPRAL